MRGAVVAKWQHSGSAVGDGAMGRDRGKGGQGSNRGGKLKGGSGRWGGYWKDKLPIVLLRPSTPLLPAPPVLHSVPLPLPILSSHVSAVHSWHEPPLSALLLRLAAEVGRRGEGEAEAGRGRGREGGGRGRGAGARVEGAAGEAEEGEEGWSDVGGGAGAAATGAAVTR
ncbi:unnamed protein product [Closterium sp. NIES-65]|nr:unnamed protein product [Closterium sp. NIES-65]